MSVCRDDDVASSDVGDGDACCDDDVGGGDVGGPNLPGDLWG